MPTLLARSVAPGTSSTPGGVKLTEDRKEWKQSRKYSHSNLQTGCCPSHLPPQPATPPAVLHVVDRDPSACSLTSHRGTGGKGDGPIWRKTGPAGFSARSRGHRRSRPSTGRAGAAPTSCTRACAGLRRRPGRRTWRVVLLPDQRGTFQTVWHGGGHQHVSCLVCGVLGEAVGAPPTAPHWAPHGDVHRASCQAERVSLMCP